MNGTEARRRLVTRLVATETIESQAQLRRLLADSGHEVTQTTISRDLEAIGATKMRNGEASRYLVQDPLEVRRGRSALKSTVNDFVDLVACTGSLVVLHVPPGAANLVAGKVDAAGIAGVLGTVAGNDTVFMAIDESISAAVVAAEIEGA
jgi:transcriptional regulator of arginine metabolism